MTVEEVIGCALFAFGAPAALFIFTIAEHPIRIIIAFVSAFFWQVSLFLSSVTWHILSGNSKHLAVNLAISVLIQETFRYYLYLILRRPNGLPILARAWSELKYINQHTLAYVTGFGFGIMSELVGLLNPLASSMGPGIAGIYKEPELFLVISTITCLCIFFLHVFWGVIMFHGMSENNSFFVTWVVASHISVSYSSLLIAKKYYTINLSINLLITLVSASIAFYVAGGTLKKCFNTRATMPAKHVLM